MAGQRHYAGIWSNQGAPSELRAAYAGFELVHQPQWDVAVAPAAKLADPLDTYRQQLAQIAAVPADQLDEPQHRLARARAITTLVTWNRPWPTWISWSRNRLSPLSVLQYRAWTLARLGKADEARCRVVEYLEQQQDPLTQTYVQIVLEAWLGNLDEAATTTGRAGSGLSTDGSHPVQRGLRGGSRVPSLCVSPTPRDRSSSRIAQSNCLGPPSHRVMTTRCRSHSDSRPCPAAWRSTIPDTLGEAGTSRAICGRVAC